MIKIIICIATVNDCTGTHDVFYHSEERLRAVSHLITIGRLVRSTLHANLAACHQTVADIVNDMQSHTGHST